MYYVIHNELAHHGILGQKWGVRRFQNADGSLKPAGEKRYNGPEQHKNEHKSGMDRVKSVANKVTSVADKVASGAATISRAASAIAGNRNEQKILQQYPVNRINKGPLLIRRVRKKHTV